VCACACCLCVWGGVCIYVCACCLCVCVCSCLCVCMWGCVYICECMCLFVCVCECVRVCVCVAIRTVWETVALHTCILCTTIYVGFQCLIYMCLNVCAPTHYVIVNIQAIIYVQSFHPTIITHHLLFPIWVILD
jgi:hypothetical protein